MADWLPYVLDMWSISTSASKRGKRNNNSFGEGPILLSFNYMPKHKVYICWWEYNECFMWGTDYKMIVMSLISWFWFSYSSRCLHKNWHYDVIPRTTLSYLSWLNRYTNGDYSKDKHVLCMHVYMAYYNLVRRTNPSIKKLKNFYPSKWEVIWKTHIL